MKLLFISNLFPDEQAPYRGLDNATVLHWLRRTHNYEVRVISPRPTLSPGKLLRGVGSWKCREMDGGFAPEFVPVPHIPKMGGIANHSLMAARLRGRLKTIRREFPYDLILASWLFPDGCAAAQIAEETGVPCVLITQGSDTHQYLSYPARRRHILRAIEQSSGVIARSGDLARRLAAAGADESKLHTIYNGVDTQVFRPQDRLTARLHLNLPPDARVLLFVGNFLPVKNPQFLVQSFARFRQSEHGKDSVLVMAGKGPLESEVLRLAQSLGLSEAIRLTGPLTSEQISLHMAAADLLCLSSRNEGLPNVILEALACGLPVLSTDVGGIAEIVTPECGVLVSEGDSNAYTEALIECSLRSKDRITIATHGSTLGWDGASEKYAEVLSRARFPSTLHKKDD